MKRLVLFLLMVPLLPGLPGPYGLGQVSNVLTHQGLLTNSSGAPLEGYFDLTFSLYQTSAGGTALWTETHTGVPVQKGTFSVRLGSITPFTGVAFDQQLYLGFALGANPEMSPRSALTSTPSAFVAQDARDADLLDGLDATAFAPAVHTHSEYLPLAGGVVTGSITNIGNPPITMGKGNFGTGNVNSGAQAFVAGSNNRARGSYSTVTGGGGTAAADSNSALAEYSTVSGGTGNKAGAYATVGGGYFNQASGTGGFVGGGSSNIASGLFNSFIGGGYANQASGQDAAIGGGQYGIASGVRSFVGGGSFNKARGNYSVVGGGGGGTSADSNAAIGINSSVSGGRANIAIGQYSTIPGGRANAATANFSFAAGRRAKANHLGSFVWSDSSEDTDFASTAANQFLIRAAGGVGIGLGNPSRPFHVSTFTSPFVSRFESNAGDASVVEFSNTSNGSVWEYGVAGSAGSFGGTAPSGSMYIYKQGMGAPPFVITPTGNVGIGPTTAINRLDVEGSAVVGATYSGTSLAPANGLLVEGNVGIGTSAPSDRLHLFENANNSVGLVIQNPNTGADSRERISFVNEDGNAAFIQLVDNDASINPSSMSIGNNRPGGSIRFHTGSLERVILTNSGNVGIGTTNPTNGKVQIAGSQNAALSYGYLNSGGFVGTASGTNAYSLYASDRIAATEFNAFSDARIKNIKGRSNSQQDLNFLMGIEVVDYTMIDTIAKGNRPQKKVIAQQVNNIYPQAVSTLTDVIPDIYKAANLKGSWIELPSELKTGDRVRLITEEKTDVYDVVEVNERGFRVENLESKGERVFVYGREVKDFLMVDYEAICMLNVSATQELYKQLQEQNTRNEMLLARVSELEATVKSLASEKDGVGTKPMRALK
jgi:hypothetical protein